MWSGRSSYCIFCVTVIYHYLLKYIENSLFTIKIIKLQWICVKLYLANVPLKFTSFPFLDLSTKARSPNVSELSDSYNGFTTLWSNVNFIPIWTPACVELGQNLSAIALVFVLECGPVSSGCVASIDDVLVNATDICAGTKVFYVISMKFTLKPVRVWHLKDACAFLFDMFFISFFFHS